MDKIVAIGFVVLYALLSLRHELRFRRVNLLRSKRSDWRSVPVEVFSSSAKDDREIQFVLLVALLLKRNEYAVLTRDDIRRASNRDIQFDWLGDAISLKVCDANSRNLPLSSFSVKDMMTWRKETL